MSCIILFYYNKINKWGKQKKGENKKEENWPTTTQAVSFWKELNNPSAATLETTSPQPQINHSAMIFSPVSNTEVFSSKMNKLTKKNVKINNWLISSLLKSLNLSLDKLIDWLIDWLSFRRSTDHHFCFNGKHLNNNI